MKKLIAIIISLLNILQVSNVQSFAKCKVPSISVKRLNLEEAIYDENEWVSQELKDKDVEIVRYEATKNIKDRLDEKIKDAWGELIRSWNSKAGPEAVVYLGLRMWEIIKNINVTDSEALKKQLEKLKEEFKKEGYIKVPLTDGEKLEAIEGGKAKAGIATGISLGLGSTLGLAVGAKMGSFIANLAIASGGTGAAVATAAGAENARIGIDKYANLKKSVSKSVCDHDWMGNNLLIMSTTKEPGCSNVATTFEDVDGVKYKISKKNLDNAFAKLECDLIGAPLEDCKERALRSIECLWKNLDDVKECDNVANIYCNGYKGEFADRFVDKETKFLTNSNEGK